jgi:hypothetical protein
MLPGGNHPHKTKFNIIQFCSTKEKRQGTNRLAMIVEILHRKLKNKEHADHYNGNRCELMCLHRKVDIS